MLLSISIQELAYFKFEFRSTNKPNCACDRLNNSLESVYMVWSIDILPGLNIVAGIHWAAIDTLSGNLVSGQEVPIATQSPRKRSFFRDGLLAS